MSRLLACVVASLFGVIGVAGVVVAQAPGAVSGRVTDPSGLPMANVVVTAARATAGGGEMRLPALSERSESKGKPGPTVNVTRSDAKGMYQLGDLGPGEYRLAFESPGFQRQESQVTVSAGVRVTLDVRLTVAPIPQFIKVTPHREDEPPEEARPGEATFPEDALERIPVARTPEQAALFAPGVAANGPNGALTMAGAFSYGNLFLVDGLAATENTRGLSRPFFIGDAVQETRVSTGAVPAEYGRFQGGVVNTITRSGGSTISGSFRLNVTNDSWRALTPYRGDATLNHRVPTWEAVLGGPLVNRRLYYFAAAMGARTEQTRTLAYTRVNYLYANAERKYQLKATWTPSRSHTLRSSYFRVDSSRTNASSGAVMDRASLYDDRTPESLMGVTHNAVLGRRVLLETRFSRRRLTYSGSGSQDTDLLGGTPIWDRSRSDARFNSPAGCAVCQGASDARNNQDLAAKMWLNTRRGGVGGHELVTGVDVFQETRRTNNYQSGSGFRVRATRSVIQGDKVFPVFLPDRTTWIYWQPVLQSAVGDDLRTYSAFASDTWRVSPTLTVKAGLRFDLNDDRDSLAMPVLRDASWSPRISATWDPARTGKWTLNAGWSRYVASINTNVVDAASPGGRVATYVYDYLGPAVNTGTAFVAPQDALRTVFDWFLAGAGVKRTTRSSPSIPGVNVRIDPALQPLETREAMAGFTRQLGRAGFIKMEGVHRRFLNFYATRRDATTGKVIDPAGTKLDVMVVTNAPSSIERAYNGLLTQLTVRPAARLQISASYTLSSTWGNVDGEDASVGPSMVTISDYPEYRDVGWSAPLGPVGTDQRHRARVWGTWDVKVRPSAGRVTIGLVQRVESGGAWSAVGNINPKAYVANLGYVTPPTSVPYYFSDRGAFRTATLTATDVSVNWSRRLRAARKGECFLRGVLTNAFNRATAIRVNRTVLTRNDSVIYQAFNPFVDHPVAGANYGYGSDFGRPIAPSDYQPPREFSISFGIRY